MPAIASQPKVICQAVWLYFCFPLSLRMVEEMLAARGIVVSHETIRQWAPKFGQEFANGSGRDCPARETSGTSMRPSSRPAG
jgi:putative transposase